MSNVRQAGGARSGAAGSGAAGSGAAGSGAAGRARYRQVPVHGAIQDRPLIAGVGIEVILAAGLVFYFAWLGLGWSKGLLLVMALEGLGVYLIKRLRQKNPFAVETFLIGVSEPRRYEKGSPIDQPPHAAPESRMRKEF